MKACLKFAALLTVLLYSLAMQSQAAGYHDRIFDSHGKPLKGRTITVCSVPATVGPTGTCTPVVNTFTHVALTTPAVGHATLRPKLLGILVLYAASGHYCC